LIENFDNEDEECLIFTFADSRNLPDAGSGLRPKTKEA
jgi:hypothetical protein